MKSVAATLLFASLALQPAFAATPTPAPVPSVPSAAAPPTTTTTAPQANLAVSGWRLECDPANASLVCHVRNQIVQTPSGALVIALTLSPAGTNQVYLTMNVPLGAAVRTPIGVAIPGGPTQSFSFLTCSQQGCFAGGAIDADLLAALRAGKSDVRVSYGLLDANLAEHGVTASLSLAGFPEVYARIK